MNELSMQQVIDRKTQLEHQITEMINDFQKETGLNIEDIELNNNRVELWDGRRISFVSVSINAKI